MKYVESLTNNDLQNLNAEDKYGRNGSFVADDKQKIFAKCIYVSSGTSTHNRYMVLTHHNTIYDPFGPDSHRENVLNTILKSASKEAFESYITYLRTRNRLYLTRANRSYIDA